LSGISTTVIRNIKKGSNTISACCSNSHAFPRKKTTGLRRIDTDEVK
jgi:hypothetical protein